MTDPQSAKELVEKAYIYIDRLTKECKKSLMPKFISEKRTGSIDELIQYSAHEVEAWFWARDRGLGLKANSALAKKGPRGDFHVILSGKNKDAKFELNFDVDTVPNATTPDAYLIRNFNISAEKSKFSRL